MEGIWIYIVVFIQKSWCGCNAMRGIGWKYSLRPLFWQEVKDIFFSNGVSEFVTDASVYEE